MNPDRRILVLGAGGHAKVVIDIIETARAGTIVGILDDNPDKHGTEFFGYRVLGGRDALPGLLSEGPLHGIVAIGHNRTRCELAAWFVQAGGQLFTVTHPAACIARTVRIGPGTVVMAGAVINPDASLGENVIVNTGALVDHDCVIGAHVHLAPSSTLCGGVSIGEGALVGVGAKVVPGVCIGKWTTLGAGAVVLAPVPDGAVAIGMPASVRG